MGGTLTGLPLLERKRRLLSIMPTKYLDIWTAAKGWLKIKNRDYTQMRDRHELFASHQAGPRRGRAPMRLDLALR